MRQLHPKHVSHYLAEITEIVRAVLFKTLSTTRITTRYIAIDSIRRKVFWILAQSLKGNISVVTATINNTFATLKI